MKNLKEEIKEEKKLVSAKIKAAFSGIEKPISEVKLIDFEIPVKNLNAQAVEAIFSKQYESFFNREFSKLITRLVKSYEALGRGAFSAQFEYVKNTNCQLMTNLFTRQEVVRAFGVVLHGNRY